MQSQLSCDIFLQFHIKSFYPYSLSLPRLIINSGIKLRKRKDVGVNLPSLIPRSGSRIALSQDKQLSQPTSSAYYIVIMLIANNGCQALGYNTPHVDASLRNLPRVSNLRDLSMEDNVSENVLSEASPTNGLVASFHQCLDPTLSASVDWLSRLQR